jgi:hypothetical protein
MALLSAVGYWFILYALKVVPQEQTGIAILISGMFPVGADTEMNKTKRAVRNFHLARFLIV